MNTNATSTTTMKNDSASVKDDPRVVRLGPETDLHGCLMISGDFDLDGRFEGDFSSDGVVGINPEAHVTGTIACRDLNLAGGVDGDILVYGTARICSTGQLNGVLYARYVEFEEGSKYSGELRMGEDAVILGEAQLSRRRTKSVSASSVLMSEEPAELPGRTAINHETKWDDESEVPKPTPILRRVNGNDAVSTNDHGTPEETRLRARLARLQNVK